MTAYGGFKSLCVAAIGVGVTVALLSGCTAEGPSGRPPIASPTASPTASLSATTTPSATPSPSQTEPPSAAVIDLEDPTTWTIDFDGVGPIALGGQISDARPSMGAFVERDMPEWCPAAQFTFPGGPVFVAHLDDTFSTITGIIVGAGDWQAPGLLSPRTSNGIGLGATLDELLQAYPGISKSGEYGGGDDPTVYYAVPHDAGVWLVFTLNTGVVHAVSVRGTPRPPSEYCS